MKAMIAFDKVLSSQPHSPVWIADEGRFVDDLMDYVVPSVQKPLREIENSGFAFVDLDGNTVDELVIALAEEILVLRFSPSSVHLHRGSVTEFQNHLDNNGITDISFSSLDDLWGDKLSPLEALEIGRVEWKDRLDRDETMYMEIRTRTHFYSSQAPDSVYVILLCKYDNYQNATYIDEIWVDMVTGELLKYAK